MQDHRKLEPYRERHRNSVGVACVNAVVVSRRSIRVASCLVVVIVGNVVAQERSPQVRSWSIAAQPGISIGEESGLDAYLFKAVAAARFLSDGRIAVADGGLLEIRVFGRDGVFLKGFGRSGRGPGEFMNISGMWTTSQGHLAVWDSQIRRVTLLNAQGELESTRSVRALELGGNLDILVGLFSNDDLALGALSFGTRQPGPPQAVADRVAYGRFSLTGEFKGTLGGADGLWRYQVR